MNKHTPGPWRLVWRLVISDKSWQTKYQIDDSFGACVVACDDITDENAEANARLIAAAPELLEALEYTLKCLMQTDVGEAHYQPAIAAIAKARGEA